LRLGDAIIAVEDLVFSEGLALVFGKSFSFLDSLEQIRQIKMLFNMQNA
jgi:hypothetical protein